MPRSADREKLMKGHTGDFDLYNLSERLADSMTDEIFDQLLYPESVRDQREEDDGDHIELSDGIKESLKAKIEEEFSNRIADIALEQVGRRFRADLREQYHSGSKYESFVDSIISGSRWIMAAVYVLLAISLLSVFFYTFIEVSNLTRSATDIFITFLLDFKDTKQNSLTAVIAPIVKLLDLVLIGSLVVMVLIGGYENTVSRIGMKHSMPVWLGKLTISELKVKVSASIVIISSIHLLMEFLQLEFPVSESERLDLEYYYPLVITSIIHLVFIFSAMAITYINKLEHASHLEAEHAEHLSRRKKGGSELKIRYMNETEKSTDADHQAQQKQS